MKKKILSLALALVMVLAVEPIVQSSASGIPLSTIAAGSWHSMTIKDDGTLWAWGANNQGQIGNGTTNDVPNPDPVKIMDSVAYVSSWNYTMAIKTDGTLWAWGQNMNGQLADDTMHFYTDWPTHSPVQIMDNVSSVSVGFSHTMAIKTDNTLWAWGRNNSGQLGDGSLGSEHNKPNPVKIMDNVAYVSAGSTHTMAIKMDGTLWAWGGNSHGELGDGQKSFSTSTPVKVIDDVAYVCAGQNSTMAIKTDGTLWAWGANGIGQLGDGSTTDRHSPVHIMDDVVSVSAGSYHSMAIKADGTLWMWGWNSNGQLGDGSTTNKHKPVKIMDNVASVSAGWVHTIALQTDGTLWAWGNNAEGQIGDGTSGVEHNKLGPIKVMDGVMLSGVSQADPLDTASSWAREGITAALDKGFVPAEIQGNYTNVITRAEFCRMAVKWVEYATGKGIDTILSERGLSRDPNAFSDTSDPDILAAFALGITNGTGEKQFKPAGQFNREQAATMIMNTCKVIGADVDNPPTSDFVDLNTAATWAVDGINFVRANGIMQGTGGGNYSPRATYTREQSILTFNNIDLNTLTAR